MIRLQANPAQSTYKKRFNIVKAIECKGLLSTNSTYQSYLNKDFITSNTCKHD